MQDRPQVTLHEPGEPHRGDVLVNGDEREPRLSRRTRLLGLAGLALVAGSAAGGSAWAQHRAEQRERAAAFAAADRVDVTAAVAAVFGLEAGSGRVGAEITLTTRSGSPVPQAVPSVRLEGPGLQPLTVVGLGSFRPPEKALPESRVDCAAAAGGRIPRTAQVVVTVVPRSQVPHEQRLPVDPAQLREAVLQACDLPDPDAVPYVEVSANGDTLVLFAETVRRSDAALLLEAVRVPGFSLTPVPGFGLPHRIEPDTGGLYGFRVAVADCAAALVGPLEVTVLLSEDGRRAARRAPDAVQQPQPGNLPVGPVLQRLVDRSC